ncbi:competence/damage-inducible protein A [Dactylococcopsis salina]|uniref:CinA-like protein n=1 Tax=Dactylococcopsis salina (strain PCC 8305) TaxID=13035 RepID=K9YX49_DACS8|nr:competence/damage-inducible protein A [Dactylococcopsis salina]AFZ51506.1 competence/damage-inducible protein CinA-like protein [Dactylococcopsis salina PCC 8305]
MSAEIICVGTELLLGDILNSNTQYLGRQLADLGIPHYFQTVVGDNPDRIKQVLKIAGERSQILLFTGGLGPTPDDLTTETIANFFETPLEERSELIADIEEKFAKRGRKMSPSNRKQALMPVGAQIIPNPMGSAAGMIWQPRPNLTIMTFPGVPSEMHRMWEETAVPFLKQQGWGDNVILSRTLRFWGIGESNLAEKVSGYLEMENPTVAPYASKGEVRLRISARGKSQESAIALINPIHQQIQEIAQLDYFGADEDTLASVVGKLLLEAKQTVAVAESCTGGGLGARLTSVSGSSGYFLGGIVAYSNEIKQKLLGVKAESLNQEGAVSGTVAQQMALGVKKQLHSDWGLSITGIAGPGGGTAEKPVGLVYLGIATPDQETDQVELRLGEQRLRDTIRHVSECHALDQLRRKLLLTNVSE